MKLKDTLATIRALGLVAGRVGGEWRINFRNSHKGCAGFCAAYCTSNKDDAFAAARAMSQWKDEHPTKRRYYWRNGKKFVQRCSEIIGFNRHPCTWVQKDERTRGTGSLRRRWCEVTAPITSSYAKC